MFKKSKCNKNLSPPTAPNLDDVLSDLETFQVHIPTQHGRSENMNAGNSTPPVEMESWWDLFEKFIVDLKCLELVHSEIEGYKLKLESQKLEIETEAKILKNEIEDQQRLIDEALE